MFKCRSQKNELLDDFNLSNDLLYKNLDELESLNKWFGSKKLLLEALDEIQRRYQDYFVSHKVVIGDLGCGNGDLLRAIELWAKSKHVSTTLMGFDANPTSIQYAIEQSKLHTIEYKTEDFLLSQFSHHSFDIICLNSVCHHFDEEQLIQLVKHLKKQTRLAIIINDLQRHWLSYYAIKWLSRVLNLSYLARNDGPISVMRAFHKQELIQLLDKAHITSYTLQWKWAFRWKLIIWCEDL
jgi:2-polyprenyl-3-methyl-5-hydroxy-6-metoxy-1,4-benzoquinol methylase